MLSCVSWLSHTSTTAGNHVTQQQQQWPIFEKNPWLQVRKSSIIPLIHDPLEFGLKQRRWKDSRDLLDVLDFLNNTWSKSYWRANKFFTLDNCLLVNNFFIRCCLKNLTHQANPRSPSAFSASNQIPIGHVLTELLKIFLPEVGGFFQMSVIVVVVVSCDSPPWVLTQLFFWKSLQMIISNLMKMAEIFANG